MNTVAQLAPLPGAATDNLAALCKAAGDTLRLDILRALRNDSFGVLELAQIFNMRQSGMSHHLKVLAKAGLVVTRREGNSIFYRRSLPAGDSHWRGVHEQLLADLDALALDAELAEGIRQLHRQRSALSEQFFARFSDGPPAQDDLLAHISHYRDALLVLLDSLQLPAHSLAIEIGPGEGDFLPDLAERFQQVIALDNAPAMLERARQQCDRLQLDNVDCLLADALQDQQLPAADCLISNMVLHHMPAPADALQQLAAYLKPGGRLVLTELCRHDQSWVRDACGDLWLGFDQADLTWWAAQAGLGSDASQYIGLRNGFQLQIHAFSKPAYNLGATGTTA